MCDDGTMKLTFTIPSAALDDGEDNLNSKAH